MDVYVASSLHVSYYQYTVRAVSSLLMQHQCHVTIILVLYPGHFGPGSSSVGYKAT